MEVFSIFFLFCGISAGADFHWFSLVDFRAGKKIELTLCMHWHQPLTKAVMQTSKHALKKTAHSLFPHPIPAPFILSTQWKSKHTRKIFPCKCEIHTGKRESSSLRFTVLPRKTTFSKVPVPPVWQPHAFQLSCQQYFNLTNTEGYDPLICAEPSLTS